MIVLLSDFHNRDGYVGIMKGVIKQIHPHIDIIDLTHEIPFQDISAAAFVLWNAYKFFPDSTIFVCVVDPGVGSDRDILVCQSKHYYFVAPDNGLMDLVASDLGDNWSVYRVTEERYFLPHVSHTFHGRDIFAPVAAHLSLNKPLPSFGKPLRYTIPHTPFVQVNNPGNYTGKILHVDIFGNVITSILLPQKVSGLVRVKQYEFSLTETYSMSPIGELLALKGSHGLLEIAVNQGDAFQLLKLSKEEPIHLYVSAIQD